METMTARVSQRKLLTREEELDLARRAKAGDQDAANTLVERNLRLVYKLASRYGKHLDTRARVDIDDLIQEGTIGLMIAVRKYDPERGVKLGTYATWWVRQMICRTIQRVQPAGPDREGHITERQAEQLADPRSLPVAEVDAEDLLRLCRFLPALWRDIVEWTFGLAGQKPLSNREIAARLGLSRSRVWQLSRKAMQRLRQLHHEMERKKQRETQNQTRKAVRRS